MKQPGCWDWMVVSTELRRCTSSPPCWTECVRVCVPVVSRLDARSRAELEALPIERTKRVEVSMIQGQDPVGAVAAGQHDQ
jgi:hypothetical protein